MTKSSFLKKLDAALASLSEAERMEILKKYETIIDEEMDKGRKQKDIIQDLGDIHLIAKLYVEQPEETYKKPYNATKMVDSIIAYINQLFEHIDGLKAKLILEIICFSSLGLLLLALVGIPFQIVHFLLNMTIYFVVSNYHVYRILHALITLGLLGLYIFAVIWFVLDYIKSVSKYIKHKYEL